MPTAPIAAVFAALGDPNRKHLLELLATRGRASATTLAPSLDVSRQAVDKHLRVLSRAGLVAPVREGRQVLYEVCRSELDRSAAWLADVGAQWDRQLEALKAAAEAPLTRSRDAGVGRRGGRRA